MNGKKILLVEDDPLMRGALERALNSEGYLVTSCADGFSAIEAVRPAQFDLIIADIRMPDIDGLEVVAQAKRYQPSLKSFVITAYSNEESSIRAVNLGVDVYLKKPFELKELLKAIREKLHEQSRILDVENKHEQMLEKHKKTIRRLVEIIGIERALEAVKKDDEAKELENVIKSCKETPVKNETRSAATLLALGASYLNAGQYDVAIKAFKQSIETADESKAHLNAMAKINLAKLFLLQKTPETALHLLEENLSQANENQEMRFQAMVLLAWCKLQSGETQKAWKIIKEAESNIKDQTPLWDKVYLALYKAFFAVISGMNIAQETASFNSFLTQEATTPALLHQLAKERDVVGVVLLYELLNDQLPSYCHEWIHVLNLMESPFVKEWLNALPENSQTKLKNIIGATSTQNYLLQIFSFGFLRVCRGFALADENEWKRKKAKTILALLLLHKRISQDELIDRLWPDTNMEKGKARLQTIIHLLKRILEPTFQEGQLSKYLQFEHNAYTLENKDQIYCDLWHFEDRILQGFQFYNLGEKEKAMVMFKEATQLYIAPFFEDGQEDWWPAYRDQIKEKCINALKCLASHHEITGRFPQAVLAAQRIINMERSNEEAHLLLMRIYLAEGNRTQALKQYQIYKTALNEDLDLEPSAAAQKLLLAIEKMSL